MMSLMNDCACVLASSFSDSTRRSLASSADNRRLFPVFRFPAVAVYRVLLFLVNNHKLRFQVFFTASASIFLRWISSWRWLIPPFRVVSVYFPPAESFDSAMLLPFQICFLFRNFSFTSSSLFFLITSASVSASFRTLSYLDFSTYRNSIYERIPPTMKQTIAVTIIAIILHLI